MCVCLTDSDVLDLRESGQHLSAIERALLILSRACPEMTQEQLSVLSIGERDSRLLTARERIFGSAMDVFTVCPACRQELELSLTTTGLGFSPPDERQKVADGFTTTIENLTVQYRLPNSADLQAVASCENADAARRVLLERCVLEVQGDMDSPQQVTGNGERHFTPAFAAALAVQMAETDPQAEVLLNLHCAQCQHEWQSLFDIATFFWTELETYAKRLLKEIYILARACHWREEDILAFTPLRRRWYLELAMA